MLRASRPPGKPPGERSAAASDLLEGQGEHLVDGVRPAGEHHDAVKTQRHAGALRQPGLESLQQPLIERQRLFPVALALFVGLLEALTLLGSVEQLVVAVTEFDSPDEELKALCEARLGGTQPRQSGLRGGVIVDEDRALGAEVVLQPRRQQEVEPGVPVIPVKLALDLDSEFFRRPSQLPHPALDGIEPETIAEELPVAELLPASIPGELRQEQADEGADLVHELVVIEPRPVPFDDGELGVVQPASLTFSKGVGDLVDRPHAGGQQTLHGGLRRGLQVEGLPGPIGAGTVAAYRRIEMTVNHHAPRQQGGLNLDDAAPGEKFTGPRQQPGPELQDLRRGALTCGLAQYNRPFGCRP